MFPRTMLPEKYRDFAFIAGGYAACPALAMDIDVWVPITNAEDGVKIPALLLDARGEILDYLESEFFPYKEEDGKLRGQAGMSGVYPVGVRKVATIESAHLSHPVHIMVCAGSVLEILSGFDISTHQIALTMAGVVKGDRWTSIYEVPRALKMTPTTPERLVNIAARFGFTKQQLVEAN